MEKTCLRKGVFVEVVKVLVEVIDLRSMAIVGSANEWEQRRARRVAQAAVVPKPRREDPVDMGCSDPTGRVS